jgi:hypothetical protein
MRILNPEKVTCYAVDKFLGDYLVQKKGLSLLMVKGNKYYFAKNDDSERAIKDIPYIYKSCEVSETKGGKMDV